MPNKTSLLKFQIFYIFNSTFAVTPKTLLYVLSCLNSAQGIDYVITKATQFNKYSNLILKYLSDNLFKIY